MGKKKIYLVTVHIDWHNCDPDYLHRAFTNKADAEKALEKKYREVKKYIVNKLEGEIEWEEEYRFETSAGDYVNGWVEQIWLID